jgi:hypothetical protein
MGDLTNVHGRVDVTMIDGKTLSRRAALGLFAGVALTLTAVGCSVLPKEVTTLSQPQKPAKLAPSEAPAAVASSAGQPALLRKVTLTVPTMS